MEENKEREREHMEEGRLDSVEVKTIWRGMVKPRDPTPCHLKTMRLSILDQMAPLFHVQTLFFYSASMESDPDQLMMSMKTSLPEALSQFYPLAGRLLDDSTLICDDQGALFIHTQVSCPLKSYFSFITQSMSSDDHHKLPFQKLLPPRDSLFESHHALPMPISPLIQLAVQVNVFECGGVVIGCYWSHKIMDAISFPTFLRHWAGLAKGLYPQELIQPNFDAIVAAFPPFELPDRELREQWQKVILKAATTTSTITIKAFVIEATAISALREKAASDRVPNPTRVESVVGFLWKHSLEAEAEAKAGGSKLVGPANLIMGADQRRRANPPLPRESIGNLGSTSIVAQVEKNGLELADLVAEIRRAIHEFSDEVRGFQGKKGGEVLWARMQQMNARGLIGSKSSTYTVSCQCRTGFTDLDFGFGKPIWICPSDGGIHPMLKNFIILLDHIDLSQQAHQGGIQAWLFLDKKEMQILETTRDFLAFASPLDLNIIN